jgi:hypothetical protein
MLTKADVIAAYQIVLDRDPESDIVVSRWLAACPGMEQLRRALQTSEEYLRRGPRPPTNLGSGSPFEHFSAAFDPARILLRHVAPDLSPTHGRLTNAYGVRIDPNVMPEILAGCDGQVEPPPIPANWHADAAEFAAVLRAVELSGRHFTMVELGCGWGCWMSISGVVARRACKSVHLIGIEGSAEHLKMASQTMAENGFSREEFSLHHGVAATAGGYALFPRAAATDWGTASIWGAREEQRRDALQSASADELRMIPLDELLPEGAALSLLHVDIQGGEATLIPQSVALLADRVAYVVIGTHSRVIEGSLTATLSAAGFTLEVERPAIQSLGPKTPHLLVDGVQGWRNSRSI